MINLQMKTKFIKCLLPGITVLICANTYSQKTITLIDAQNKHIQYEGRIGLNNPGIAEIYWPGSSVKIRFKGTGIKAILKDQRGDNSPGHIDFLFAFAISQTSWRRLGRCLVEAFAVLHFAHASVAS